jgi:hypothetical protein
VRDDVGEVVVEHVLLRRDDLRETGDPLGLRDRRLDEEDVGARGDRVRPFDVQRGLAGPPELLGVAAVEGRGLAGRMHDRQLGVGVAEGGVERVQVLADGRRAERVHERDRPARPGPALAPQRFEVVGACQLCG